MEQVVAINQMDAGPELDALIAEKVMGIDPQSFKDEIVYRESVGFERGQLPAFSTDMTAAWRIVEKFHFSYDVEIFSTGDWVSVKIDCSTPMHDAVTAWADTAPLAICLAALKAVDHG